MFHTCKLQALFSVIPVWVASIFSYILLSELLPFFTLRILGSYSWFDLITAMFFSFSVLSFDETKDLEWSMPVEDFLQFWVRIHEAKCSTSIERNLEFAVS